MAMRAEEITHYDFAPSDELFLDANIWLFVYAPQRPGNSQVDIYSKALADILKAKSKIYIDVLILSEFINRYARIQYNLLPDEVKPRSFKEYRRTQEFIPVAKDIVMSVRKILQHCVRVESGFDKVVVQTLLDEFAEGNIDFNDQMIARLCNNKGWKLITDDGDFKGGEISLITANKHLLI